jgi:hypothetical protein
MKAPTQSISAHHQYSARVARPLKLTYFEKQVLMASAGDIIPALVSPPPKDILELILVPHEVQ